MVCGGLRCGIHVYPLYTQGELIGTDLGFELGSWRTLGLCRVESKLAFVDLGLPLKYSFSW